MNDPDAIPWHLRNQFEGLKARRILALDGGGIRGVITAEVLVAIEQQLREQLKRPRLVLADYFDYIAGTSTGAIIATALALGKSAEEVKQLYLTLGKQVFVKGGLLSRLRIRSSYDHAPLVAHLRELFGEQDLSSEQLRTMLLVVMKNASTDSAWPISNNPYAKYNKPGADFCNLKFKLWQLVRASTAAPTYFRPEIISMYSERGTKRFAFIDGGTTAYNNPAFLAYRMATEQNYWLHPPGLAWPKGEDKLLLVSVGTGLSPLERVDDSKLDRPQIQNAIDTLRSFVYQTTVDQDISCRMVGRCLHGHHLDQELDRLIPPVDAPPERRFSYVRYNVELSHAGLRELEVSHIEPRWVSALDAVGAIDHLSEIGKALARKEVKLKDHFPEVFHRTARGAPAA